MDKAVIEANKLGEELLKSHWPKCDQLAKQLLEIGGMPAHSALLGGLKAKRHHIRSASIKGLAELAFEGVDQHIRPHLGDSSYEVRINAKEAIKKLTGEEILTSLGE